MFLFKKKFKPKIVFVFFIILLVSGRSVLSNNFIDYIVTPVGKELLNGIIKLIEEEERRSDEIYKRRLNASKNASERPVKTHISSSQKSFRPTVSNKNKYDNQHRLEDLFKPLPRGRTQNSRQTELIKKPVKNNSVTFKDIVGLDSVLDDVKEVVDYIKNPEKYKKLGALMPRGILLEGPPGTGKTMMARAIANEAGCNFVYQSASSFVEMYVGVGAKRVRELFEKARSQKPAIIFIDELDAIGAVSRGGGSNDEYRQTINELLCQLDGFDHDDQIVVIAATNFARSLDKALTRAGRFDRIIEVGLPDEKSRQEILEHYINKLPATAVSFDERLSLARRSDGCSGADLKNLVNEAALAAVRDNATKVEERHFAQGLQRIMDNKRL